MANPLSPEKVNPGLLLAFRAFQEHQAERDPDDGITITLTFQGDLKAIEALGFETHSVSGDQAMGMVRFKDVPALVAHPGVLSMAAGMPRKLHDTAVADIRARSSALANADGLWFVDPGHSEATNTAAIHGAANG
ncbi:MAG TPA: hypothetical protein VND93_15305, partial [Myxococcales bacterium]|nr:hypothetical protein [Myxococcales bacterium]